MSFIDPASLIEKSGVRENDSVADIGCGSGEYIFPLAWRVGPEGHVYALDIQKELLNRIAKEAHRQKLSNIDTLWVDLEAAGSTKLSDSSVDAVIASNIFFQIQDKRLLINEIERILKKGGHVLIVDWTDSFGGMGPQPDVLFTIGAATKLCEEKNFTFVRQIPAGDHHYALLYRK